MHFVIRAAAAATIGAALMAASGGALMAGAATAAYAGSGTKATASQFGKVTVQPDPAVPHGRVMVFAGKYCSGTTGTASSMAFSAPAALRRARAGQLAGSTSIRGGALGTYPVIVACGREEVSGSVRVVRRTRSTRGHEPAAALGHDPAAVRGHKPAALSPKGPAAAGDGTTSRGSDATMTKAGLAIVGLGAVVGLVARRRGSRSRT
jgi:hypothetical protein